jgi:ABC-type transporter lipoprotein component MlaA
VPKCAGSSVNAVFSERLPDRTLTGSPAFLLDVLSAATPEENDRRYDAVVGHFFWGLDKYFTRPPRYFSVVRDPVERICSFFNYIHVTETHGLHRYLKENLTDLNDISERLLDDSPALREQWDNYACRA